MNSSSKTSIPVFFAADNSLALYVPVKFYVREIINLIEINYNLSPGYIFSSDKRILSSDFIVDESIEALLFHQSPDLTLENHNSDIECKRSRLNVIMNKLIHKNDKIKVNELEVMLPVTGDNLIDMVRANQSRPALKDQFLNHLGITSNMFLNFIDFEFQSVVETSPKEQSTYHVLDQFHSGLQNKIFAKTGCPIKQSASIPMFYDHIKTNQRESKIIIINSDDFANEVEVALIRGLSRLHTCRELYATFVQYFSFVQLASNILVIHGKRIQDSISYSILFITSADLKCIWNAITADVLNEPLKYLTPEGMAIGLFQQSLKWAWWDCLTQPLHFQQHNLFRILLLNSQAGSVTVDSIDTSLVVKLHSDPTRYQREANALQKLTSHWKDRSYALGWASITNKKQMKLKLFQQHTKDKTTSCAVQMLLQSIGIEYPSSRQLHSIPAKQMQHCGLIIMRYGEVVNVNNLQISKILHDVSNTFYALQEEHLCHTDIRLQNILYFPQFQQYQLIDYDRVVARHQMLSISEELQFRSALPTRIKVMVEQWHGEENEDLKCDHIVWTFADDFQMLIEAVCPIAN